MLILKFIIRIAALSGLILVLGDNLGWFVDEDKIEFLEIISEKLESIPEHEGARKFLKSYLYPLPATREEKNKPIDKIIFVGTFQKRGDYKEIVSGVIKVRNTQGETTKALCTYSELRSWSKESFFWKWAAWLILAISIFAETIIFIFEVRKKLKSRPSALVA